MPLLFLFSPGDEINSSKQQAKIETIAEIETVGVKENAIADHEETGDQSGISMLAPLLAESGEKGSHGVELHGKHFSRHSISSSRFLCWYLISRYSCASGISGIEIEADNLEQAKMVSAVEAASTPGLCII